MNQNRMDQVFIYHGRKPGFSGETLYPLNALREHMPEVYAREAKKYEGREWLMSATIPGLEALWNDVVHFSLMHPSLIYQELSRQGFTHHKIAREWFEVPVTALDGRPAVIYKNTRKDRSQRDFPPHEFEPVDPRRIRELSGMPERNRAYYAECLANKSYPLLWAFAPHVLVKSRLDISGFRVINWQGDI